MDVGPLPALPQAPASLPSGALLTCALESRVSDAGLTGKKRRSHEGKEGVSWRHSQGLSVVFAVSEGISLHFLVSTSAFLWKKSLEVALTFE